MTRQDILLAALSTGGQHAYTPVQIQKLLFLIDKNAAHLIGGPFYNFVPYDYGPFDSAVYSDIRDFVEQGEVIATPTQQGWSTHALTASGMSHGKRLLAELPSNVAGYIEKAGEFVRNTSFSQLVSAVYKAYPEMKVNSVFREG